MHGLIVPVLLSDRSRSGHVRAPHDCLQGLHKARAESALQGRNTRWQGHSEISGAPWLVGGEGWGFIACERWPGPPRALGALLSISSHFTDGEKRPSNP